MNGLASSKTKQPTSQMHVHSRAEEASSSTTDSNLIKSTTNEERMHPSLQALLRDDPGLACLTSQLGRVNAQIRCQEDFKKRVVAAELEIELAKSLESSTLNDSTDHPSQTQPKSTSLNQWEKHWYVFYRSINLYYGVILYSCNETIPTLNSARDNEVKAEYWYNTLTGEASWLDPRMV